MSTAITAHDGVTIRYRTVGEGPRAVLLVHGWMVSSAVWNAMIEHLDLRGLKLIVPDLRGTGASDRPASGYTLADYARDLLAVADHAGAKTFAVVGHSMGGQIAQWLAAHHADRVTAAVMLCPVPATGMQLPPEAVGLFRTSGGNRGSQGTILDLACKQLSADAKAKMLDDAGEVHPACVEQAFEAWTGASFANELARVTAPALVVATDDPFLPPGFLHEQVVSRMGRARLAVLPGPGHYPQVERPRETAALVEAFLAGSA